MNRPAVVAGAVGVGLAFVVALAFELIFAIQALVFLLALPIGLLIGYYAATRDRSAGGGLGWARALANGFIAGAMTGIALALFYVTIRLVFFYFDTGFRAGGPPFECASGPECSYQRALAEPGLKTALRDAGVHDAAGYSAFFLEGQVVGGGALALLALGGALAGSAVFQATRPAPGRSPGSTP